MIRIWGKGAEDGVATVGELEQQGAPRERSRKEEQ